MIASLSVVAFVAAMILVVPTVTFYLEVLLSLGPDDPSNGASKTKCCTTAVIVPAHNESQHLVPTLRDIQAQLDPGDRLVVVADNCDDDTAEVARSCQAEVIVRDCPDKKGKSYALDWGVKHLGRPRPDTVIIIDADCRLAEHTLTKLKQACFASQRPVQALDLMGPAAGADHAVSTFAWLVKNLVRPLGLRTAGLPCHLMGTGMALPMKLIEGIELATGHLAEDVCLGLACTRVGRSPLFLPDAAVTSTFANTTEAVRSQRRRWEHGHLQLILLQAVPSLVEGVRSGNMALIALGLDLLVPPVTLLGFLLIASLGLSSVSYYLGGTPLPLILSSISLFAFVLALVTSWFVIGRELLPVRKLIQLPSYALEKGLLYVRLIIGGFEKRWIRTERK